MPNPKRKHTRSRRDSRRSSNWKLELGSFSKCTNCGAQTKPHRVCAGCGFYGGKLVVAAKVKKSKGKDGGQQ